MNIEKHKKNQEIKEKKENKTHNSILLSEVISYY